MRAWKKQTNIKTFCRLTHQAVLRVIRDIRKLAKSAKKERSGYRNWRSRRPLVNRRERLKKKTWKLVSKGK